jgi:hypothetical protein
VSYTHFGVGFWGVYVFLGFMGVVFDIPVEIEGKYQSNLEIQGSKNLYFTKSVLIAVV